MSAEGCLVTRACPPVLGLLPVVSPSLLPRGTPLPPDTCGSESLPAWGQLQEAGCQPYLPISTATHAGTEPIPASISVCS